MLPPDVLGIQATVTEPFPTETTETDCTGFGGASGVTLDDVADAEPEPSLLVAVTVNVYATPFVRPVTATKLLGYGTVIVTIELPSPGVAVMENVSGVPPVTGSVHPTFTSWSPAVAMTVRG